MLKDNDILICKDGAGIGKLGIIKDLKEQATTNFFACYKMQQFKCEIYLLLSYRGHFQNIVQAKLWEQQLLIFTKDDFYVAYHAESFIANAVLQ
jgi:hypothetical protein